MEEAGIACKVLHLVRDPRDVVVSINAFDALRGTFGFGRTADQSDREYLDFVVGVMRSSLRETLDQVGRPGHKLVRYEELVGDLAGAARRARRMAGRRRERSLRPGARGRATTPFDQFPAGVVGRPLAERAPGGRRGGDRGRTRRADGGIRLRDDLTG